MWSRLLATYSTQCTRLPSRLSNTTTVTTGQKTIGSENAVWPPDDGRKDARNMLRNKWLPIKSLIVASSWSHLYLLIKDAWSFEHKVLVMFIYEYVGEHLIICTKNSQMLSWHRMKHEAQFVTHSARYLTLSEIISPCQLHRGEYSNWVSLCSACCLGLCSWWECNLCELENQTEQHLGRIRTTPYTR